MKKSTSLSLLVTTLISDPSIFIDFFVFIGERA